MRLVASVVHDLDALETQLRVGANKHAATRVTVVFKNLRIGNRNSRLPSMDRHDQTDRCRIDASAHLREISGDRGFGNRQVCAMIGKDTPAGFNTCKDRPQAIEGNVRLINCDGGITDGQSASCAAGQDAIADIIAADFGANHVDQRAIANIPAPTSDGCKIARNDVVAHGPFRVI